MKSAWGSFLLCGLPVVLLLAVLCAGSPGFHVHALAWLLLVAPLPWLASRHNAAPDRERPPATAWILVGGMLLFLFSTAASTPTSYLLHWWPDDAASLLKPMLVRWLLLSLAFGLGLLYLPRLRRLWLPLILLAGVLFCAIALFRATGFRPVYGDDHPSFMHRFWVFAQTFPRLFYYDPTWNGGRVGTYIVASGAAAPAFFLLPFLKLFPLENVYTPGLAWLFMIIVPLAAYGSLRAVEAGPRAASCAAILALGTSWEFFTWMLHFGTIGATFAGAFMLPVAALLYRVLVLGKRDVPTAVALIAASCVFLAWPGYWVISLVLVPPVLLTIRKWDRPTVGFLAICTVVILLAVLPLAVGVAMRTSVARFAANAVLVSPHEEASAGQLLSQLADRLRGMSPLLLFLGLAGLPFVPGLAGRGFPAAAALGLLALTGWGGSLPGGLSVERAFLPLGFLLVWPAALWCDTILDRAWKPAGTLLQALVASLLLVHAYSAARYYGNESVARYRVLTEDTSQFIEWLEENTPPGQRVLFGGISLHAYGGGHVASLPVFTGREMVAADFYHFSPKMVEYFAPPRSFRAADEDVFLYTDVLNIGAVVAYNEPSVIRFYRKYPAQYEEVGTYPGPLPKTLFRVRRDNPSFFLANSGSVHAAVNRIEVALDDPDSNAAIKYLYSPELRTDPGVELFPYPVRDLEFIGIRPGGRKRIVIRHGRFW